jgi:hypothetical protein
MFAVSFAAALTAFALWGGLCARALLGLDRIGPWTAVYLGQFAMLAAAAPAMALNGLCARWLGASVPLPVLVLVPTIALAVVRLRRTRIAPQVDALALLGLGCMAVVVAIYSRHISALGLDVHEHLAWIRQIVTRGYVPLAEPDTRIIGDYPRTFHVLAALWNAAGFGVSAGPFAKLMPFVQNGLPLLALAEQLVEAGSQDGSAFHRRWEVALGVAFFAYAFLLVPLVYPTVDLSGTPRFASAGVLLLPVVLLVISRVRQAPRASAATLTTAPLLAAWAASWNPILIVVLVVATAPVMAVFWAVFRPPSPRQVPRRARIATFAACCGLALLVLAQDPWVADLAARKIPAVRAVVHRAGLTTFDEAVAAGSASPREKSIQNRAAVPPCGDLRCVAGKAANAAREAVKAPVISAATAAADAVRIARSPSLGTLKDAFKGAFLVQPALVADYAGLPLLLFIAAGVLCAGWRAVRLRRESGSAGASRLLVASLLGLAAASVGLAFATGLAAELNDGRHESFLLAGYLGASGYHVSLGFLWLPFVSATLVLLEPILRQPPRLGPSVRGGRAGLVVGLALWLALPLTARLNLHRAIRHQGFWTPIAPEDVRALRRIEEAIPAADGVIVPAEHFRIHEWENWVLPLGETTALLPYGERRYLFNVYLGASYPLSWRDLEERFCSKDEAVRAAFLERTRARFILVRDRSGADARAVAHRPRPDLCGLSLSSLGAELPPVREESGILLFRLRSHADEVPPR